MFCQVKTLPAVSGLCFLSRGADPHSALGYYSGDQGHFHYFHIRAKVSARQLKVRVGSASALCVPSTVFYFHFTRQGHTVQVFHCSCRALHQPNKWNIIKKKEAAILQIKKANSRLGCIYNCELFLLSSVIFFKAGRRCLEGRVHPGVETNRGLKLLTAPWPSSGWLTDWVTRSAGRC